MPDTTTIVDTHLAGIVDTHLAGYAEPDPERRRTLLDQAWAPDGVLLDPPFDGAGVDAIAALTDAVLEQFPGHTFRRSTDVDQHHDRARYGWELVAADGAVSVSGTDIVRFGHDGRLVEVVGFFGDLPTAA